MQSCNLLCNNNVRNFNSGTDSKIVNIKFHSLDFAWNHFVLSAVWEYIN